MRELLTSIPKEYRGWIVAGLVGILAVTGANERIIRAVKGSENDARAEDQFVPRKEVDSRLSGMDQKFTTQIADLNEKSALRHTAEDQALNGLSARIEAQTMAIGKLSDQIFALSRTRHAAFYQDIDVRNADLREGYATK
jgi:hypothetical protein